VDEHPELKRRHQQPDRAGQQKTQVSVEERIEHFRGKSYAGRFALATKHFSRLNCPLVFAVNSLL
jgi:hypothetical protein